MNTTQHEPPPLVPGEDYYMEDGLLVMTAAYHKNAELAVAADVDGARLSQSTNLGQSSSQQI